MDMFYKKITSQKIIYTLYITEKSNLQNGVLQKNSVEYVK